MLAKKCNSVSPECVSTISVWASHSKNGKNFTVWQRKVCLPYFAEKMQKYLAYLQNRNSCIIRQLFPVFGQYLSGNTPLSFPPTHLVRENENVMSEKGKESAIKCFFVIIVVGEMAVCEREKTQESGLKTVQIRQKNEFFSASNLNKTIPPLLKFWTGNPKKSFVSARNVIIWGK